jgi:hypothetical protein
VEAAVRQNFSVNLRLKPLRFLMDNISMDIASFYMFSSLPYGEQTRTRISPGLNFALRSAGARLPLRFVLIPTFTFNHLWDNREENFTDFNYSLSLQKEIGKFTGSVDYTLASRYRAENFWIQGNNRQNLNLNLQLNDQEKYSVLMRFYFNNNLDLENISFTGRWDLFHDLRFSSFLLYYSREKKFQTLEVFLEKTFKKRIKIQGGYSLALKRFFIKFLTLNPKFKTRMSKISFKNLIYGAAAPQINVLNFEFRSFEFVSDFVLRASDFLKLSLRNLWNTLLITILLTSLTFITAGCGVKIEQLPLLSHPYVSEVEFLKEVKNVNGKAKKTPFENDRITSPFCFFLKIKEIENNGTLAVVFYEDADKTSKKVAEKTFFFGEPGKYYEYIIFFDQLEGLNPGKYRCVVFLNQHLIYECQLQVTASSGQGGSN